MNINLNTDSKTLEACLKTVNNFGFTVYHNICTGQQSVVSWGAGDWIFNVSAILIFLVVVVAFLVFLISLFD